jgi:hypothetical protein
MLARVHSILLAAGVALLAAAPAVAVTPRVKDEARFFSADTVQKADRVIREIKDGSGKDLLIETFPTVPDDHADKVKHMDRSERERFFEEWARERARREGVDGVYVLICKEPGHVQVEVGNETRRRAFPVENRDHLRDILVEAFKAREYDRGLLEAVEYVRDAMKDNLGECGRARAGGAGGPVTGGEGPRPGFALGPWVLGLLCLGVVGLLVVIALVRWLSRAGSGYGPGGYAPGGGYGPPAPGYGYGGGGGGFFGSLFGSLFGSAAGNWMYDRFFRGGSPNYGSGGGYAGAAPAPGPDVPDRPDTDYSGAGGDFDSDGSPEQDGGGGDFGGSELGSGDFYGGGDDAGGADFGGGGDSGGGGDF